MKPEKLNHGDTARRITEWDELDALLDERTLEKTPEETSAWDMSAELEKHPPTGRLKEIIDQFNEERIASKLEKERRLEETERLRKAERKEAFIDFAKSTVALAAVGILIIAGVSFVNRDAGLNNGPTNIEDQKYYGQLYTVNVSTVTFTGSPNLRSQPHVSNSEEPSNSYGRLREDSVTINVDGKMYILDNGDPNGPWCGIAAKELSDILVEEGYITEEQAKKMARDKDGNVWASTRHAGWKAAKTTD